MDYTVQPGFLVGEKKYLLCLNARQPVKVLKSLNDCERYLYDYYTDIMVMIIDSEDDNTININNNDN